MYSIYRRGGVIPSPPLIGDYTVAKQNPGAYFHHFGPNTWEACRNEMRRLRVPGW